MPSCTMLGLLVCCLCLTGLSTGSILMEVAKELQLNQVGKPVCELRADLRDCEPAVNSRSHLARPGTVCRNNTGSWQCYSNGEWKHSTEARQLYIDMGFLQNIKRQRRIDIEGFQRIGQLRRRKRWLIFFWSCWFWCRTSRRPPPPNRYPTIKCPTIGTQRPDVGKSVRVTWKEPVGKDPEQGSLGPRRNGPGPGRIFGEGAYVISYHVTDNKGASASCHITFKVEVYRCRDLPWPRDGIRTCTDGIVSGSTCSVECDDGFEVEGSSSVTCNKGTWNGTLGKCQPISCGPEPEISNGNLTCPEETVFETICTLSCDKGFQPRGNVLSMCNKDGNYSSPGTCQDKTAPVFPKGCPLDIECYAEMHNKPKAVTWPLIKVTDNTGNITVTSNPANGSLFNPGVTTVTLTATDENGNSAGCKFKVTINTLHCPEPDLGDDRLMYNCPDGYGYGYTCSITCKANFPQAGSSSIVCDLDETAFPPRAIWTWPDGSLKPFCKTVTCPDLPAPENGALACDAWTNGLMCVMLCNEQYDIPMNAPPNDMYLCGENKGIWFPNDKVYGCTVLRRPGQMELANEFYYYAGSCVDEATRKTIADNFIHILNTSLTHLGICGVPGCQNKFVDVRCGETGNNTKRSINKRESHMVIVEFFVYYDLIVRSGENFPEVSSRARQQLNRVVDVVTELVDNGELDMTEMGLTVQSDSYLPGYPRYHCENGVAENENGSCRGCPKGTFKSESGVCVDCPIGKYNDVDFASSCTNCDEGLSTKSIGSTSPENCTALCPTGSYSSDGVEPCILCDPGTFADSIGSTTCTPCPETETSLQGATSSSDCVAYDLGIDPGSETIIAEVTSNLTSATLAFWFRADTGAGHTLLMLKNSEENPIVGVSVKESIHVEVNGGSVDTGAHPVSNQWQHVGLTLDGSTNEIAVFLVGQEVYRDTHSSLGTPVVPETSSMTSTAVTDGGILLSGITFVSRLLSTVEIESMANSCISSFDDSVFKFLRSGKILVAPSLCDSDDGCKEGPCGSHPCRDTIGSFHCDCQDGWTGTTCEIPPDFCANHECQNDGICKNNLTDFACECSKSFRGKLCQIPIVDGKWSEWTSWTACSKTCGGGVRERSRACDSPPPDDGGEDCEGEAEELEECGVEKCKECSLLTLSYGNEKTCWEEDNLQRCNVTCRSGMLLSNRSELLQVYECGAVSDFMWNHQVTRGEKARPPACTEPEGAASYSAVHEISYPELSCTYADQQRSEINSQISYSINDLPCVKDNTCSAETKLKTCGIASRLEKRAITSTVITVTLTVETTQDIASDLEAFISDGNVSDTLESYVKQVINADMSVQQMVNDSETLFRLNLNDEEYNIDLDSMTTKATIKCPPGTISTDGMCAGCSPGTRELAGSCVLCETGSYQDLPASTECKPCPKGKTTLDTGSLDVTECSVNVAIQAGCPPGTREQAGSCVLCETGSYQDLPASTECKPCPKGKTTLDTGSLHVSECSAHVLIAEEKGEVILPIVLPCVIVIALTVAIAVVFLVLMKSRKSKRRWWPNASTGQRAGNGKDSKFFKSCLPSSWAEKVAAP